MYLVILIFLCFDKCCQNLITCHQYNPRPLDKLQVGGNLLIVWYIDATDSLAMKALKINFSLNCPLKICGKKVVFCHV